MRLFVVARGEGGGDAIAPLYSRGEKMVAKSNCPIFDDWGDYIDQAASTQNQAFPVFTVPFSVNTGTVNPIKYQSSLN